MLSMPCPLITVAKNINKGETKSAILGKWSRTYNTLVILQLLLGKNCDRKQFRPVANKAKVQYSFSANVEHS